MVFMISGVDASWTLGDVWGRFVSNAPRRNGKTTRIPGPHSPHVASQLWKRVWKCEGVCDLTFQGVSISGDWEDRCCFGAFGMSGAAWNARALASKGAGEKMAAENWHLW